MRGQHLLICLLVMGCGPQDTTGRASFLFCRASSGESCPDDTGEQRVEPALFSHAWSEHGDSGIVATVEFPVPDPDARGGRRALLWLDLDLEDAAPDGNHVLSPDRWEASYVEHRGSERVFSSESARGWVMVTDFDLIGDLPPALRARLDVIFEDADGDLVRVTGELVTTREPRVIERRIGGTKINARVEVCANCFYGCGQPAGYGEDSGCDKQDSGSDEGGGCGGDDSSSGSGSGSSSGSDSGSGCGGDGSGSGGGESGCGGGGGDSGCGGGSGGGGSGCGGGSGGGGSSCAVASVAGDPARRCACPRSAISLPRLLDLLLPMLLGLLLRLRPR